MKTLKTAIAALALFAMAGTAYADKENLCIERTVVANYVGGSGTFTTCYVRGAGQAGQEVKKECETERK